MRIEKRGVPFINRRLVLRDRAALDGQLAAIAVRELRYGRLDRWAAGNVWVVGWLTPADGKATSAVALLSYISDDAAKAGQTAVADYLFPVGPKKSRWVRGAAGLVVALGALFVAFQMAQITNVGSNLRVSQAGNGPAALTSQQRDAWVEDQIKKDATQGQNPASFQPLR